MASEPLLDLVLHVRGVVVENDVDRFVFRHLALDPAEEANELLVAVALHVLSDHLGVAPNLLDSDFLADAPNRKWAGDISYIWTAEGWLYLAVVIDLFSRRVVGWAVSDRMTRRAA